MANAMLNNLLSWFTLTPRSGKKRASRPHGCPTGCTERLEERALLSAAALADPAPAEIQRVEKHAKAAVPNIAGLWNATINTGFPIPIPVNLDVTQTGKKFTATASSTFVSLTVTGKIKNEGAKGKAVYVQFPTVPETKGKFTLTFTENFTELSGQATFKAIPAVGFTGTKAVGGAK